MADSKDEQKKDEGISGVWVGRLNVGAAIALLVGSFTLLNHIDNRFDKFKSELIAEIGIFYNLDTVTEWAKNGKDFSVLWPLEQWPNFSQLPTDTEQNARLDAVESLVAILRGYSREHCEITRDSGGKKQSCTEL